MLRRDGDQVSEEMLKELKSYLKKTKDQLGVNWEFLDSVDRTK